MEAEAVAFVSILNDFWSKFQLNVQTSKKFIQNTQKEFVHFDILLGGVRGFALTFEKGYRRLSIY